ncbi:MAG: hypothetical protein C0597_00015 [Marinilabiliales bacterium]|nr:MAG: hypothetical protein C0597_00015 [Marinilabiliales bacterium]
MKKQIILIGFFLSFAFLFNFGLRAQEKTTDCRVLLSSISEKYEGECVNGFADGKGIAEGAHKYEGEFKKGLPH